MQQSSRYLSVIILVLVILVCYFFWQSTKRVPVVVQPMNPGKYEDIIDSLKVENDSLVKEVQHYTLVVDSLSALKPKIKIIYRDQKNFVNSATLVELDSTLRANVGLR
jgi:hypothetical protein